MVVGGREVGKKNGRGNWSTESAGDAPWESLFLVELDGWRRAWFWLSLPLHFTDVALSRARGRLGAIVVLCIRRGISSECALGEIGKMFSFSFFFFPIRGWF